MHCDVGMEKMKLVVTVDMPSSLVVGEAVCAAKRSSLFWWFGDED